MKPTPYGRQAFLIAVSTILFAVFLIWAQMTRLDLVTHGQGRVVPRGQNQTVQVPASGTIVRFEVQEGDRVEEGDLIAEINPTEAASSLAEIEKRLRALDLRLWRLDAEVSGAPLDATTVQVSDDIDATLMQAEIASALARRADLELRETALSQAKRQRERDLDALRAELDGISTQSGLLDAEVSQLMPMIESGILGLNEKFRLEREVASSAMRANVLEQQIASTEFAIAETEANMQSHGPISCGRCWKSGSKS